MSVLEAVQRVAGLVELPIVAGMQTVVAALGTVVVVAAAVVVLETLVVESLAEAELEPEMAELPGAVPDWLNLSVVGNTEAADLQQLTGHLMRSPGFGDQLQWVVLGQQIVVVVVVAETAAAEVGSGVDLDLDVDEVTMLTAGGPMKML